MTSVLIGAPDPGDPLDGLSGPSDDELAAIAAAEPVTRAELDLLDAELEAMTRPSRRAHRRVRKARRRLFTLRRRPLPALVRGW